MFINDCVSGMLADSNDILDLLGFLSEFADKCHHGKEEDLLIPGILKSRILENNGPISAILSEHVQGRDYIAKMRKSINGGTIKVDEFLRSSMEYVTLLRDHIRKENTLLFPLIEARMPMDEQHSLYGEFMEFEYRQIGYGRHEELHSMLERLEKKYPSRRDPESTWHGIS
ncbi:MAG: hemerythrin [Bacteroidales bacterium]|jgi:hemerythrin-like domain-containing protein|nr:hemerythrin [Bacteroidales bacterium]